MKKVWLASVIVVVVALVGVGVYWAYWLWPAPAVEREKPALTATVERGALQRTVKALGEVGTNPNVTLSFARSGVVTLVSVAKGDEVVAGQVLAQLDTTDTNLAIQQAEAALRAARAQLAIAQQGATPADLAAADAALIAAQAQLAEIAKGPLDSDYAAAQASLSSARAAYAELLDTTSNAEAVEQARLAWEQAKNALWAAQAERDAIVARSSTSQAQKDQLEAGLNTAELEVDIAELAYVQAQEGPSKDAIEAAKAAIAAAEAQVARLGVDTDAQVKAAAAAVAQAEARIAALKRLPTAEAVEAGQAGVAQAEAALESARRPLQRRLWSLPMRTTRPSRYWSTSR